MARLPSLRHQTDNKILVGINPESGQIVAKVIAAGGLRTELPGVSFKPRLGKPKSIRLNDGDGEMLLRDTLVCLNYKLLHLVYRSGGHRGGVEAVKNCVIDVGEVTGEPVHIPLQHFNRRINIAQCARSGTVSQRILLLAYYDI